MVENINKKCKTKGLRLKFKRLAKKLVINMTKFWYMHENIAA